MNTIGTSILHDERNAPPATETRHEYGGETRSRRPTICRSDRTAQELMPVV